ncbi:MAG: S8 family serine peptidase, partial [Pseudomonadota bacterium]
DIYLVYQEYLKAQSSNNFNPAKATMDTLNGCWDQCILEQTLPVKGKPKLIGLYQKVYSAGTVHTRQIKVYDNDRLIGHIVFNYGNGVSMILVYSPSWNFPKSKLNLIPEDLYAFTRNWHPLRFVSYRGSNQAYSFTDKYFTGSNSTKTLKDLDTYFFKNRTQELKQEADIILCEKNGFDLNNADDSKFDYQGLVDHLIIGPYSPLSHLPLPNNSDEFLKAVEAQGGNLLGWTKNESRNPLEILPFELGLLSGHYTPLRSPHGLSVAQLIHDELPSANLIVLKAQECDFKYHEWKLPASKAKAHVVNYTYSYLKDAVTGMDSFPWAQDKQSPFLWVIASGNKLVGQEMYFPQNIAGGKDNMILVTAINANENIEDYTLFSNSDIAAPGHYEHEGQIFDGTSYATPRVAIVASQVAKEYPELTPVELRLALLLSARLPKNNRPFPIRSGGIIDLPGARKAGNAIMALSIRGREKLADADESTSMFLTLLNSIFCGSPSAEKALCKL